MKNNRPFPVFTDNNNLEKMDIDKSLTNIPIVESSYNNIMKKLSLNEHEKKLNVDGYNQLLDIKNKIDKIKGLRTDIFNSSNELYKLCDDFLAKNNIKSEDYKIGNLSSYLDQSLDKYTLLKYISEKGNIYDILSLLKRPNLGGLIRLDNIEESSSLYEHFNTHNINNNIINEYGKIIQDIDTIEFNNTDINLDIAGCLIDDMLYKVLDNSWKNKRRLKIINKSDNNSFYVVVFNILKSNNITTNQVKIDLIYNYTQYSKIFFDLFYCYIIIQQFSMLTHNKYYLGSNYFFFIDKNLIVNNKLNRKKDEAVNEFNDVNTKPYNFIELCKLIVKGKLIDLDINSISSVINMLYERNYKFLIEYLNTLCDKKDSNNILREYNTKEHEIYNPLSRFVFVVSDLNDLKDNIINKSENLKTINAGSQKFRGSTSYINNILNRLDKDFRDSMYNHSNIYYGWNSLRKNKFSYKNIHNNLGYSRWYHTINVSNNYSRKNIRSYTCNYNISYIQLKKKIIIERNFINNKHFEINNMFTYFFMKVNIKNIHTSRLLQSKFNIYTELKYFLDNNPINDETQIKIEKFLLKNGLEEINTKSHNDIGGLHGGLYSKKTTEFLLKIKPDLLKKIKGFIKFKNKYEKENSKKSIYKLYLVDIIEKIGVSYILTILLGRYIKILSNTKYNYSNEQNLALDVALDLSKDLIRQYLYLCYKKHTEYIGNIKEYSYSDWKKENISLFNKFDNSVTKVSIGVLLIEWLEDCNLLTKKLVKLSSSQHNIYSASDNMVEVWEKALSTELLTPTKESEFLVNPVNMLLGTPVRLPTIVRPKPYIYLSDEKVRLGGYLLNDVEYDESLLLKNHTLDKESIIHENRIYDVINKLNSIGYIINREVLDFININPKFYKNILLSEEHDLYNKSKLSKKEKKILQTHISKLELQNHILSIANLYSDIPEFFFINRIDNRGRIYCVTEYLNYQSTELAKALLLFSKPNSIYRFGDEISLLYFKAYGANCFGNKIDKLSIKEKVEWVEFNQEKIIKYENGELIEQAENKFLFTSFCVEFKKWWNFYHKSSDSFFNTHLPIQLDATCNGFQHLVLLTGETNLRKSLNLTKSTFSDRPEDFYSYILELLKDYLNKLNYQDINEEKKDSYERIRNYCLDRKLIKNMIMTIPYNATSRKIVDDMTNILIRVHDNGTEWFIHPHSISQEKLSYKDLLLLVSSIKVVLNKVSPKISKLKDYLHKIAEICTKLEIHIPWLLPTGLEVRQSYLEQKTVKIKPFSFSRTQISLNTFIKKLDLHKQTRAFMPNLIHSLDAASLMLLLEQYFNSSELSSKNIYTIHDCFAMPMNHVEYIIDNLRKIYTLLYSDSYYLDKLDKGILDVISYHYRNVEFIRNENKLIITQDNEKKVLFYPNIKEVIGESLPLLDNNIEYIIK